MGLYYEIKFNIKVDPLIYGGSINAALSFNGATLLDDWAKTFEEGRQLPYHAPQIEARSVEIFRLGLAKAFVDLFQSGDSKATNLRKQLGFPAGTSGKYYPFNNDEAALAACRTIAEDFDFTSSQETFGNFFSDIGYTDTDVNEYMASSQPAAIYGNNQGLRRTNNGSPEFVTDWTLTHNDGKQADTKYDLSIAVTFNVKQFENYLLNKSIGSFESEIEIDEVSDEPFVGPSVPPWYPGVALADEKIFSGPDVGGLRGMSIDAAPSITDINGFNWADRLQEGYPVLATLLTRATFFLNMGGTTTGPYTMKDYHDHNPIPTGGYQQVPGQNSTYMLHQINYYGPKDLVTSPNKPLPAGLIDIPLPKNGQYGLDALQTRMMQLRSYTVDKIIADPDAPIVNPSNINKGEQFYCVKIVASSGDLTTASARMEVKIRGVKKVLEFFNKQLNGLNETNLKEAIKYYDDNLNLTNPVAYIPTDPTYTEQNGQPDGYHPPSRSFLVAVSRAFVEAALPKPGKKDIEERGNRAEFFDLTFVNFRGLCSQISNSLLSVNDIIPDKKLIGTLNLEHEAEQIRVLPDIIDRFLKLPGQGFQTHGFEQGLATPDSRMEIGIYQTDASTKDPSTNTLSRKGDLAYVRFGAGNIALKKCHVGLNFLKKYVTPRTLHYVLHYKTLISDAAALSQGSTSTTGNTTPGSSGFTGKTPTWTEYINLYTFPAVEIKPSGEEPPTPEEESEKEAKQLSKKSVLTKAEKIKEDNLLKRTGNKSELLAAALAAKDPSGDPIFKMEFLESQEWKQLEVVYSKLMQKVDMREVWSEIIRCLSHLAGIPLTGEALCEYLFKEVIQNMGINKVKSMILQSNPAAAIALGAAGGAVAGASTATFGGTPSQIFSGDTSQSTLLQGLAEAQDTAERAAGNIREAGGVQANARDANPDNPYTRLTTPSQLGSSESATAQAAANLDNVAASAQDVESFILQIKKFLNFKKICQDITQFALDLPGDFFDDPGEFLQEIPEVFENFDKKFLPKLPEVPKFTFPAEQKVTHSNQELEEIYEEALYQIAAGIIAGLIEGALSELMNACFATAGPGVSGGPGDQPSAQSFPAFAGATPAPIINALDAYNLPGERAGNFIQDVTDLMTGRQMCRLLNGTSPQATLILISELIDRDYPEYLPALSTLPTIRAFFITLGAELNLDICEEFDAYIPAVDDLCEQVGSFEGERLKMQQLGFSDEEIEAHIKKQISNSLDKIKDLLSLVRQDPAEIVKDNFPALRCEDLIPGGIRPSDAKANKLVLDTIFGVIKSIFRKEAESFKAIVSPSPAHEVTAISKVSTALGSLNQWVVSPYDIGLYPFDKDIGSIKPYPGLDEQKNLPIEVGRGPLRRRNHMKGYPEKVFRTSTWLRNTPALIIGEADYKTLSGNNQLDETINYAVVLEDVPEELGRVDEAEDDLIADDGEAIEDPTFGFHFENPNSFKNGQVVVDIGYHERGGFAPLNGAAVHRAHQGEIFPLELLRQKFCVMERPKRGLASLIGEVELKPFQNLRNAIKDKNNFERSINPGNVHTKHVFKVPKQDLDHQAVSALQGFAGGQNNGVENGPMGPDIFASIGEYNPELATSLRDVMQYTVEGVVSEAGGGDQAGTQMMQAIEKLTNSTLSMEYNLLPFDYPEGTRNPYGHRIRVTNDVFNVVDEIVIKEYPSNFESLMAAAGIDSTSTPESVAELFGLLVTSQYNNRLPQGTSLSEQSKNELISLFKDKIHPLETSRQLEKMRRRTLISPFYNKKFVDLFISKLFLNAFSKNCRFADGTIADKLLGLEPLREQVDERLKEILCRQPILGSDSDNERASNNVQQQEIESNFKESGYGLAPIEEATLDGLIRTRLRLSALQVMFEFLPTATTYDVSGVLREKHFLDLAFKRVSKQLAAEAPQYFDVISNRCSKILMDEAGPISGQSSIVNLEGIDHNHKYEIDSDGNGYLIEILPEGEKISGPAKQHQHEVRNYIVQAAQYFDTEEERNATYSHVHVLEPSHSKIHPSIALKELFKREYDVIVEVMNDLMDEFGVGTSRINNYRDFEKHVISSNAMLGFAPSDHYRIISSEDEFANNQRALDKVTITNSNDLFPSLEQSVIGHFNPDTIGVNTQVYSEKNKENIFSRGGFALQPYVYIQHRDGSSKIYDFLQSTQQADSDRGALLEWTSLNMEKSKEYGVSSVRYWDRLFELMAIEDPTIVVESSATDYRGENRMMGYVYTDYGDLFDKEKDFWEYKAGFDKAKGSFGGQGEHKKQIKAKVNIKEEWERTQTDLAFIMKSVFNFDSMRPTMPIIVHEQEEASNGNSLKYSPDAKFANENTRERCRSAARPSTAFRALPLGQSVRGSVDELSKTSLFIGARGSGVTGRFDGRFNIDDFVRKQFAAGSGANLAYLFGRTRVPRADEFPFVAAKRGAEQRDDPNSFNVINSIYNLYTRDVTTKNINYIEKGEVQEDGSYTWVTEDYGSFPVENPYYTGYISLDAIQESYRRVLTLSLRMAEEITSAYVADLTTSTIGQFLSDEEREERLELITNKKEADLIDAHIKSWIFLHDQLKVFVFLTERLASLHSDEEKMLALTENDTDLQATYFSENYEADPIERTAGFSMPLPEPLRKILNSGQKVPYGLQGGKFYGSNKQAGSKNKGLFATGYNSVGISAGLSDPANPASFFDPIGLNEDLELTFYKDTITKEDIQAIISAEFYSSKAIKEINRLKEESVGFTYDYNASYPTGPLAEGKEIYTADPDEGGRLINEIGTPRIYLSYGSINSPTGREVKKQFWTGQHDTIPKAMGKAVELTDASHLLYEDYFECIKFGLRLVYIPPAPALVDARLIIDNTQSAANKETNIGQAIVPDLAEIFDNIGLESQYKADPNFMYLKEKAFDIAEITKSDELPDGFHGNTEAATFRMHPIPLIDVTTDIRNIFCQGTPLRFKDFKSLNNGGRYTLSEAYREAYPVLIDNLRNTPEHELLFKYIFPYETMLSLTCMYTGLANKDLRMENRFKATRETMLDFIMALVEDEEIPYTLRQYNDLSDYQAATAATTTDSTPWGDIAIRAMYTTPRMILKGVVTTTDPCVGTAIAINDLVMTVAKTSIMIIEQVRDGVVIGTEGVLETIKSEIKLLEAQVGTEDSPESGILSQKKLQKENEIKNTNPSGERLQQLNKEYADLENEIAEINEELKEFRKAVEDGEKTLDDFKTGIRKTINTLKKIVEAVSPYMVPIISFAQLPSAIPYGFLVPPPPIGPGVGPPMTSFGFIYCILLIIEGAIDDLDKEKIRLVSDIINEDFGQCKTDGPEYTKDPNFG